MDKSKKLDFLNTLLAPMKQGFESGYGGLASGLGDMVAGIIKQRSAAPSAPAMIASPLQQAKNLFGQAQQADQKEQILNSLLKKNINPFGIGNIS